MPEQFDLSKTECTDGKPCGPYLVKRGEEDVWCCMYCGMPVPVTEAPWMTECEFKNLCDGIGYTYPCENDEKDIAYCAVRITLNSPQFKKQYAKLSVVEEAFKSSIRNPHNTHIEWTKEELAELDDILATVLHNHGLEGEMGNECEVCGKESIVKLNGVSLCQECYDKKLAKIVEIVNRNPGPLGMVQLPRED